MQFAYSEKKNDDNALIYLTYASVKKNLNFSFVSTSLNNDLHLIFMIVIVVFVVKLKYLLMQ